MVGVLFIKTSIMQLGPGHGFQGAGWMVCWSG